MSTDCVEGKRIFQFNLPVQNYKNFLLKTNYFKLCIPPEFIGLKNKIIKHTLMF